MVRLLYIFFKRLIDIVLSLIALILLSPIFLIIFILDRFGANKGPLLFRQIRMGKNGKKFKILKFRSMVVDANDKLMADPDLYAEYVSNNYKLPEGKDPRVTKLGKFLRRSSIDEIPQFFNILVGEMSLVGPRPIIESELLEYGNRQDEFLSMRPGAMGYWQATGRSNIGYPERCEVELYYIRHAGFIFDCSIFFKNIVSIFLSRGAY